MYNHFWQASTRYHFIESVVLAFLKPLLSDDVHAYTWARLAQESTFTQVKAIASPLYCFKFREHT